MDIIDPRDPALRLPTFDNGSDALVALADWTPGEGLDVRAFSVEVAERLAGNPTWRGGSYDDELLVLGDGVGLAHVGSSCHYVAIISKGRVRDRPRLERYFEPDVTQAEGRVETERALAALAFLGTHGWPS